MVACPLLVGVLLAIVCWGYGQAQVISFVGDVGCAQLPPGPPSRLRTRAGNEKVTLFWDKPENGACVDEYLVEVEVDSPNRRFFFDWEPLRTSDYKLVIKNLQNGVRYKFTVKAVSNKFNTVAGGTASATPRDRCRRLVPGKPTGLRATAGDQQVELCWDGVENDACVDEFKVRAVPVSQDTRWFFEIPEKTSKGGCVTIDELGNHQSYEFTVQAWSNRYRRGGSDRIIVAPQPESAWTCYGVPDYYPRCDAAEWGLCRAFTCKEQARKGKCTAPWMQEIDWEKKSIVQHCSDYCGCPSSPVAQTRSFVVDDYCCASDPAYGGVAEWLDSLLD